jgi:hypothetical protein
MNDFIFGTSIIVSPREVKEDTDPGGKEAHTGEAMAKAENKIR